MTESRLRTNIAKRLRELGAEVFVIHQSGEQEKGLCDLLVCYQGRFYGIEVKLPGKLSTLSAKQKHVIRRIRNAGGIAAAVTNVDDAVALLYES